MLRFSTWKVTLVLGICLLGLVYTLPNLFPREQMERMPNWLRHQQINLGLDLQGGSHLLLEVDLSAMVKERLDGLVDEARSTLRPERIGYRNLGVRDNVVTFTLTDPAAAPRALELLRKLDQSVGLSRELVIQEAGEGRIEIRLTDDAVQEMQRAAVTQSLEIVRRRIDEVGTREPTIQRQGNDRILVQVPGEKDPESIKRLLGQTAKLTFHLVDLETPVQQGLAGNLPPGSELLRGEGLDPWVVREVWYTGGPRPDHLVDVTDTYPQKLAALAAHRSQTSHMNLDQVMRERLRLIAEAAGLPEGRLAEAFSVFRTE